MLVDDSWDSAVKEDDCDWGVRMDWEWEGRIGLESVLGGTFSFATGAFTEEREAATLETDSSSRSSLFIKELLSSSASEDRSVSRVYAFDSRFELDRFWRMRVTGVTAGTGGEEMTSSIPGIRCVVELGAIVLVEVGVAMAGMLR